MQSGELLVMGTGDFPTVSKAEVGQRNLWIRARGTEMADAGAGHVFFLHETLHRLSRDTASVCHHTAMSKPVAVE